MDNSYMEITVMLPVSQFAKVEAMASGNSRPLDAEASFLLSKWVFSTRGASGKGALKASVEVAAGGSHE